MSGANTYDRLIRKLETIAEFSAEDLDALRRLPMTLRQVQEDGDIVREGERPTECCLVVEGFLFRYKILAAGERQILSLHVPGDIPDLQSLYLERMDHSLGALAPSTVALIPHSAIQQLVLRHPTVASALWKDTLIEAAIFREWLTNVGRRSAYQRMAHLLCEFFIKMTLVGMADRDSCVFPVTQQELADALGLSLVHVNRTLQTLRSEKLVVLSGKRLSIPDWDALKQAGEFDAAYLQLEQRRQSRDGEALRRL